MVAVAALILLLTAVLLLYIFMAGPKLPTEVETIIDQVIWAEISDGNAPRPRPLAGGRGACLSLP